MYTKIKLWVVNIFTLGGACLTMLFMLNINATKQPTAYAYPPPNTPTSTPPPKTLQVATSSALSNFIGVIHEASEVPWYSPACGNCWIPLHSNPANFRPSQIALAPKSDGSVRFLIAIDGIGIYRTGDIGRSWALHSFSHPSQCNEPDKFEKLAASLLDPNRLYIIKYCYYADPFANAGYYEVYTSPDSGLSWQNIRGGGQAVWTNLTISPLLTHTVYVMNGSAQWFRSDNAGQTWNQQNYPVHQLTLDAQNASWLYGIYLHGVNGDVGKRSTDGGTTWADWEEMPCPQALDDKQLLAHPTQSKTLFLRCTLGLFRSLNGGTTWTELSNTPGDFLVADQGKVGRILWAKNNELLASENSGTSWQTLVTSWSLPPDCLDIFLASILK